MNEATHPRSTLKATDVGDQSVHYIDACNSPTHMPVAVTDAGMRRLANAALKALHDGTNCKVRLELAWERAVANGEIGEVS